PTLSLFNLRPPPASYTLSLHDALPIWAASRYHWALSLGVRFWVLKSTRAALTCSRASSRHFGGGQATSRYKTSKKYYPANPPSSDRKSTRLNSSHVKISYAVFCLKKKK